MNLSIIFNNINVLLFRFYHAVLVPLRYRVTLRGGELVYKKRNDKKGILFLSNHPSHLDATLLTMALRKLKCPVSIWTLDDVFKNPYTRMVARNPETVTLMKVPNIYESRKKNHQKKLQKLIHRSVELLRQGRNVLFFPSGNQKYQGYEEIHGKSAIHRILQQFPDVNIMVIQITGMWGSRFSRAVKKEERSTARGESMVKFVWNIIKIVLLNFIFFIPKRKITIKFIDVGEDFPRKGTRQEINSYIENKFNTGFESEGEPLLQVSNYFWKTSYTTIEYHLKKYIYDSKKIPLSILHDIKKALSKKTHLNPEKINLNMNLQRDLGLDSLDLTEITMEIENKYHLPPILPKEVYTVGDLAAIASGTLIEDQLEEGKKHLLQQEVVWPVRAYNACAAFFSSLFRFRES